MSSGKPIDAVLQLLRRSDDAEESASLLADLSGRRVDALGVLSDMATAPDRGSSRFACWVIGRIGNGHPLALAVLKQVASTPERGMFAIGPLARQGNAAVPELLEIASGGGGIGDEAIDKVLRHHPSLRDDILKIVRDRLASNAPAPYHPLVILRRLNYRDDDLYSLCRSYLVHESPIVRRGALQTIEKLVPDETARIGAARAQVEDGDHRVRMQASYFLARAGVEVAENVRRIAEVLSSSTDHMVLLWALEYLRALGEKAGPAAFAIREAALPVTKRMNLKKQLTLDSISGGVDSGPP